jgi:transcriptional regulator with XRE-family HTH domain
MDKTTLQPYSDVGARLRRIAKARDLTGAEIARRTENRIPPSHWTEYTQGKRQITVKAAIELHDITGATLDYIYLGDESALPWALLEAMRKTDH